jgi:hypothetical protein
MSDIVFRRRESALIVRSADADCQKQPQRSHAAQHQPLRRSIFERARSVTMAASAIWRTSNMAGNTEKPALSTRIRWSLRRRGITGTAILAVLKCVRYLDAAWFDRAHGVETRRTVELPELEISSANVIHGIRYQVSPRILVRRILRGLKIDYRDFVFVDLGSGKASVLLIASAFPFREIVGVEFSPELHEAAARNIESFQDRAQKCRTITSLCMDAAEYAFPHENLVLYFFSPFGPPVMRRVMESLAQSLRNLPRKCVIIKYDPMRGCRFEAEYGFTLIEQRREYEIYSNFPS